jgi:hypothetical protein
VFEKIEFSLGQTVETKVQVVQKFRSLIQPHFETVLDTLLSKRDALIVKSSDDLLDISQEVLQAPS